MRKWFITGISRGFGKILAQELLDQGHIVFGTTRNGVSDIAHKNLTVGKLDVTDAERVKQVVKEANDKLSGLDVIVNNAGFGCMGAIEEATRAEYDRVFATNFFGAVNVIQAALPYLRAQKSGHIVNVSSIAGFAGMAGFGVYNASKFALEGMSEALAQEVKPLGIQVTIVEPGSFRTDFLEGDSIMIIDRIIDDYKDTSHKMRRAAETRSGQQEGDPVLGSKLIIEAVMSENPPLRLVMGSDALDVFKKKFTKAESDVKAWESRSRATAIAV